MRITPQAILLLDEDLRRIPGCLTLQVCSLILDQLTIQINIDGCGLEDPYHRQMIKISFGDGCNKGEHRKKRRRSAGRIGVVFLQKRSKSKNVHKNQIYTAMILSN